MKKERTVFEVPKDVSIQGMLLRVAKTYATKTALEDLNPTPIPSVTYDQLLNYVLRFSRGLKAAGLKERTHVALIGENRVQWSLSYLTLLCSNMVVVPIDKNLTQNEILNILHESDSEAVIYSDAYKGVMGEARLLLKKLHSFISMDAKSDSAEELSMSAMISRNQPVSVSDLPPIVPDETAEIIFTSGSLGRAKGVMLTQKNLSSNLVSMRQYLTMYPEDRFLSVLPIHHTYECTCGLLCPLFSGSSVHYARSLKTVTEDMLAVKPTILLGVPLLYDKMFKRIYKTINSDKTKSRIIPPLIQVTGFLSKVGWKASKKTIFKELHEKFGGCIRIFIVGGAAPDPVTAKGLRDFGFSFIQGYGLTETAPILALNRIDEFKDDAAGLPLPGVTIRISQPDENGAGEIIAKGDNIMPGYYKNPEQTNLVLKDGWFYTGDIGFFDEDGFLHISGRKKNVIITKNGKNVFPEEIEDYLNKSPFILESVAYSAPTAKSDDVISALIVPDPEAFIEYSEKNNTQITPELVHGIISSAVKEVNEELPAFKRIVRFTIRDKEFEKTTTQKIKRYLVNASYAQSNNELINSH